MNQAGYVIARPWDEARYGMALVYLANDGETWLRGTKDERGNLLPGGGVVRIYEKHDFCLDPSEEGTSRYGRLRVDVDLDEIREREELEEVDGESVVVRPFANAVRLAVLEEDGKSRTEDGEERPKSRFAP